MPIAPAAASQLQRMPMPHNVTRLRGPITCDFSDLQVQCIHIHIHIRMDIYIYIHIKRQQHHSRPGAIS